MSENKQNPVMTLEQAYDNLTYKYTTNLEKYIALQDKYTFLLEKKIQSEQKETK